MALSFSAAFNRFAAGSFYFNSFVPPSFSQPGGIALAHSTGTGKSAFMGFKINRTDDREGARVVLSVQGSLTADCADLLESEVVKLLSGPLRKIHIELKDLTFLDESGANALAHLKERPDVCLEADELFTGQMIKSATKQE